MNAVGTKEFLELTKRVRELKAALKLSLEKVLHPTKAKGTPC
jgi:hypothetical protein